jgi:sec-independent protein translocase protein TatA
VFGLRPLEMLIIVGLVLLFFGPKRLPGLGSSLGSAIRGFKKSISGQDEGEAADEKPPLPPSSTSADPNSKA